MDFLDAYFRVGRRTIPIGKLICTDIYVQALEGAYVVSVVHSGQKKPKKTNLRSATTVDFY